MSKLGKAFCLNCSKEFTRNRQFQKHCSKECGRKHNSILSSQRGYEPQSAVLESAKSRHVEWPWYMDFEPENL